VLPRAAGLAGGDAPPPFDADRGGVEADSAALIEAAAGDDTAVR
jgi:hypothetical protein